jgi:hypothetical protein
MMLLALLAAMAAPASPAETPRAFVARLYAGYRDEDYSPLARPERVFAPPLVAAIREDARLSKEEVGFMDADPLCQCQDAAGLHPVIETVRQPTPRTATAQIGLSFSGSDRRALRLQLIRTRAGWRIADIATAEAPSLLADLRRFNRRRSRR